MRVKVCTQKRACQGLGGVFLFEDPSPRESRARCRESVTGSRWCNGAVFGEQTLC